MARFTPVGGHTGGEYSQRFTHEQAGHMDEQRTIRIASRPGSHLEPASLRDDENWQIDIRGYDPGVGNFKVQLKTAETDDVKEKAKLLSRGIIPVTIEHGVLIAGDRDSISFQGDHATEYARGSFWAQVEAFAPVAERGERGQKISEDEVRTASNRAEELTPNVEYSGPQSFSP